MSDYDAEKLEINKPKGMTFSEWMTTLALRKLDEEIGKINKGEPKSGVHQAPITYSDFDPIQAFHDSLKTQEGLFSPN